jgi:heme exporter protein D
MIDFGKNTAFILASYGVSILVLGTLVILTLRKPRI